MLKRTRYFLTLAGVVAVFVLALAPTGIALAQNAAAPVASSTSCTGPTAPSGFGYYKVRKGDTPQSIATNFGVPLATVRALNPGAAFTKGSVILLPSVEAPGLWDNAALCGTTATIPSIANANLNASTAAIPVTGSSAANTLQLTVSNKPTCTAPSAPAGYGYYVIRKGDTPQSIANRLQIPLSEVLTLNPGAGFARNTVILLPSVEAPGMWDNGQFCSAVGNLPSFSNVNTTALNQIISATPNATTSTTTTNSTTSTTTGNVPVTGGTTTSSVTTTANTNQTCSAPSAPPGYGYYVVKKGETPQSIANSFGVPLTTVLSLNAGKSFARNSAILLPSVEAPGLWDNGQFCPTNPKIPPSQ